MGQKIKKKAQAKKHVKSNKSSFTKKIIFNFKNGQKSIFEVGKNLKLPEMQFHEKKLDIFDFMSFFFLPGLI